MREKFTQRKWATAPATLLLILAMGMSGGLFGCSSREISSDSSLPTETSRDAVQYSALPIAQAEPRECFDVPSYLQKTAFVGEKVVIGKIVPVEEKAKDVRSYVVNGNEVVQTERGVFYPQQEGVYQCIFEYTFEEERYRYSYNVEVAVKDGPVFLSDPLLPVAAVAGKSYQLPILQAFDYLQQQAVEVTASVLCGDESVPLSENGMIQVPENGADTLIVVWQAGSGDKQNKLERKIPVVNIGSVDEIQYTELFTNAGWNEKTAQDNGIVLMTTARASTTFVNPVIINSTDIRFGFGENDCAGSIAVTMTSCEDPSVSISVAFDKGHQSEGTGAVILNGQSKKSYAFSKGKTLGLRYNAASNQYTDADGNFLFSPEFDINGNEFSGFQGGCVYLSWQVEDVYGRCDLRIEKIGTQIFNTSTKDVMSPTVSYDQFNSIYHLGDEIVVSELRAVDMVDPNAEMIVSAYLGTGENLTLVESTYQNNVFKCTPTKSGMYTIRFQASDSSGNETTRMRIIYVYDRTNPQITIANELPSDAKHNKTLNLPAAIATDDEEVTIALYVTYPSGQMRMLQHGDSVEEQEYTLTEEGKYRFRYVATDKSGNSTLKEITVQVSGDCEGTGGKA